MEISESRPIKRTMSSICRRLLDVTTGIKGEGSDERKRRKEYGNEEDQRREGKLCGMNLSSF